MIIFDLNSFNQISFFLLTNFFDNPIFLFIKSHIFWERFYGSILNVASKKNDFYRYAGYTAYSTKYIKEPGG